MASDLCISLKLTICRKVPTPFRQLRGFCVSKPNPGAWDPEHERNRSCTVSQGNCFLPSDRNPAEPERVIYEIRGDGNSYLSTLSHVRPSGEFEQAQDKN